MTTPATTPLMAGFAEVDITPGAGVWLESYDRREPSHGLLDRLSLGVLVLAGDGEVAALVSVDNVTVPVPVATRLRSVCASELGVSSGAVMLAYTHSHSTPRWSDENPITGEAKARDQWSTPSSYESLVRERLLQAVQTARAVLAPATVRVGQGQADASTNSRAVKVALSGEIERGGERDSRVTTIVLHSTDGRPLACIFRYTAHPTVLTGESNVISADWPGRARRRVSAALGCPTLFIQGAAGDISPGWRGSENALEKMGEVVGDEVIRVVEHGLEPAPSICTTADRRLRVKLEPLPEPDTAERLAREAERAWDRSADEWRADIAARRARGERALAVGVEIQALRVGRTVLVGLPMEPFVSYATRLRSEAGEDAFLNGYANGWLGYLPHEADLNRGGYQVDWAPVVYGHTVGVPTRIAAGEPARISREVARLAASMTSSRK